MTTTSLEDVNLGSALATLWHRHRQTNLDRISLLELTAANVLRAAIDDEAIAMGAGAAHKLAGSLGTFGFDAGSRAALEAECLLREPVIDGRLLAEAVTALRASVEEVGDASLMVPDAETPDGGVQGHTFAAHVTSSDTDLIARLTVDAAAIGLAITSTHALPTGKLLSTDLPSSVIIDDQPTSSWKREDLLHAVSELAAKVLVIVLTDGESFENRLAFARAGASAIFPRSQGSAKLISFLAETLTQQVPAHSAILALTAHAGLATTLRDALSEPDGRLEIQNDPFEFWHALEERGADLVIVGFGGPQVSGPDICRMVRGHPRWNRLPVIVIGEHHPRYIQGAMAAGADDYLHTNVSSHDLGVRVRRHLARAQLAQSRSDTDPLTGTENREAAERSLDQLLRLASRLNEPFALALTAVDQLDEIRETEGSAMADVVLRRLGARLQVEFPGDDLVGRWTHDGFVVGIHGVTGEAACERIADVLRAFSAEDFPTTSGKLARYTFNAGVASFPADGSSLSSLQRLSETALRRATTSQNSIVATGERPADGAPNVVDVVLVEDDDTVADVIEYALGLRDYSFLRFSDGAEAARALGEGQVKGQVVLLDVGLPSLDGFGVLQILRSQGILEETRVIMLTARSSEAEMLRALGLGATEHVTTPFSIPVLLGRLDQTRARASA
jgi:diguanylate cyclase (GGDEF)-like protein